MESFLFPIEQFQSFLIVLSRVAGFMGAVPALMSGQTPTQVKVGLTVSCAIVLFPLMAPFLPELNLVPITFFLIIFSETLLGFLIGFISRIIFTAVEFGATVIGYQMGFAAANVFDPSGNRQVALLSQFQNVFAILIFLSIDGHHIFIETAAISYQYLPPGKLQFDGPAVPYLIELMAHMFAIGAQFSAPVLAMLLLSGLILGILARIFSQLNVFMLSFPLNIAIGFTVIALTLPLLAMLVSREFDQLSERILNLLTFLNG